MKSRALLAAILVAGCDISQGTGQTTSTFSKPKPKVSASPASPGQTDLSARLASLLGSRTLAQMIYESAKAAFTVTHKVLLDARNACGWDNKGCSAIYADGTLAAVKPAIQDGAKAVKERLGTEAAARGDSDAQFTAFIGLQVDSMAATLSAVPPSPFVDSFLSATGSVDPLIATKSVDVMPFDVSKLRISKAAIYSGPNESDNGGAFLGYTFCVDADAEAPWHLMDYKYDMVCFGGLSCSPDMTSKTSGARCMGVRLASTSFSVTIKEARITRLPTASSDRTRYTEIATCSVGATCP